MLSSDLRAAKAVMYVRTEKVQQQAESASLLLEAGLEHRGWLSEQSCWLLCRLGRKLVELDKRLEKRYSLPLPVAVEG